METMSRRARRLAGGGVTLLTVVLGAGCGSHGSAAEATTTTTVAGGRPSPTEASGSTTTASLPASTAASTSPTTVTGGSTTTASGVATTGGPTSSAPAPVASTSTTTTAGGVPGDPFLGLWHVHDGQLAITAVTQGKLSYAAGGGAAIIDELDLQLGPGGASLTATVHFAEAVDASGASVPNPDPAESFQAGDTFELVFAHPGVLEMVNIETGSRQVVGNPYWCNATTPVQYQNLCGA